jgi:putative ABC transport system permease protein
VIGYLIRTLRLGFKSLAVQKLRTGLAVLGILIGVTAVIWLVALGEGVSQQAQRQIRELGATNIIIKSVRPPQGSEASGFQLVEYGLTRVDYRNILEGVPSIRSAVRMRETSTTARFGDRDADVTLLGITSAYREINRLEVAEGRFLSPQDEDDFENIAVVGPEAAIELFGYESPIGKFVEVSFNNTSGMFKVIGVTQAREASASIGSSLEGREFNHDIYIPLSTFRARIGDQTINSSGTLEGEVVELSQITVTVGDVSEVEEAADIIRILLEKAHPKGDFSLTIPRELKRQADMLRMLFNVLLVLIAGISLLVGGIGIMNIMLATVTERTREIGIRRALGATQLDIVFQFLAETTVLSGVGGVVGVGLGFLCGPTTGGTLKLIKTAAPEVWGVLPKTIQDLQPWPAWWSVISAFVISLIVGIFFGLYPAYRAARLDPIEALRHE